MIHLVNIVRRRNPIVDPTEFNVTGITDTSVTFTWDNSGTLQRATQSDFSDAVDVFTGASGYTDSGLTQDTTYYYRIGILTNTVLTFTTEYDAVLDRGTALGYSLPSLSQRILQNALVVSLKSSTIWTAIDVLYVFATNGDSDFATINWKAPASFQASKVNSPTFTTNVGFTGNGSSSYLNTNWTPSLNASQYQINNAAFFGYFSGTASGMYCGTFNVSPNAIRPGIGNYIQGPSFGTVQTLPAFYTVKRTNGTQASVAKDGGSLTTSANTGAGSLDNQAWRILLAGGSLFSQVTCGFMAVGNGAINHVDFYNAWNTYRTSL